MLASVDPHRALNLLREEHAAVRDLINTLTDDEMTRPDTVQYGLYPDQTYSFKDLLAHLTAYEVHALEALTAWHNGEKHPVSDAIKTGRSGLRLHYASTEDRVHLTLKQMIDACLQTQDDLERAIEQIDDVAWRATAPYMTTEPTDLGGMLEAILVAPPRPLYRHLPVHIPNVHAYIQRLRGQ